MLYYRFLSKEHDFMDSFGFLLICIFFACNAVYIFVRWQHWKTHFRERHTRSDPRSPCFNGTGSPKFTHPSKSDPGTMISNNIKLPSADELNADNVRVTFSDFLWVSYMIVPNAALLWGIAIFKMFFKRGQKSSMYSEGQRRGHKVNFSHERLVAKMLLESAEIVHYEKMVDVEAEIKHAIFRWHDLDLLNKQNRVTRASEMTVVIALPEKIMVSAVLDDTEVSAKQTTILVAFHNWGILHPKLHAFANWAVNVENYENPHLRQASVITVMYNHFGFRSFPIIARWLYNCGIAKQRWSNLQDVWEQSLNNFVPHFKETLKEIEPFSNTCRFLMSLRQPFFAEFEKHKASFPFINKRALFLGTVMHSIDHCNAFWNVEDHTWFDVDDERFGNLAELCRFVLLAAVDDPPLVQWPKRCYNSHHPFFKRVFEIAISLDSKLASHMDIAIVK